MDLDFLNDVKNSNHSYSNKIVLEDLQTCPKCNSLMIEDNICQSCDYNLDYNPLGDTLGEKSFFTLKENYLDSLSRFERENLHLFKNESKFQSYLNKVKFRYNDLLDFFYAEESIQHPERSVYLYELSQVVLEMMNSGVNESEIWTPMQVRDDLGESHTMSLYDQIRGIVSQFQKDEVKKSSSSFMNYEIAGVMKVSTLFLLLSFIVLALSFTLALLSYRRVII